MPHNRVRRNDDQEDPGQTHLNSDAKIAGEGRPQGAPLPDCLLSALCPGEGAHKGCPYQLSSLGVMPWGGRPQGVPLPIVFSRRYALGRAPTRGAPTDSLCPGEGTHKGCPYRFVMPWGGHPQGAPLPIRYALGRAPTRGAPTDSLCPGEGTHKGRPYRFVMPWGGRPQGAPLPDSGSLTWVCPNLMQLPCKKTGLYYTKFRLVEG